MNQASSQEPSRWTKVPGQKKTALGLVIGRFEHALREHCPRPTLVLPHNETPTGFLVPRESAPWDFADCIFVAEHYEFL